MTAYIPVIHNTTTNTHEPIASGDVIASAAIPTADLADLLTSGTATGVFVTAEKFRAALGSSQDRKIIIQSPGVAISATTTDSAGSAVSGYSAGSGGGSGIIGFVIGGSSGNGVSGIYSGSGIGHGVYASITGGAIPGSAVHCFNNTSGSGHAVDAYVGSAAVATGSGYAANFVSYTNGARLTALRAIAVGANTTWAGYFDGPVYSSAGYTTSDRRLKREIADIDTSAAVDLLDQVRLKTFLKIRDPGAAEIAVAAMRERGDNIGAPGDPKDDERIRNVDTSDDALAIGYMAGPIAQEIQKAAKAVKAFDWLVKPADTNANDGVLALNSESLLFILIAGVKEKINRIEDRMSALEAASATPR